jgi:hypothetical protein
MSFFCSSHPCPFRVIFLVSFVAVCCSRTGPGDLTMVYPPVWFCMLKGPFPLLCRGLFPTPCCCSSVGLNTIARCHVPRTCTLDSLCCVVLGLIAVGAAGVVAGNCVALVVVRSVAGAGAVAGVVAGFVFPSGGVIVVGG